MAIFTVTLNDQVPAMGKRTSEIHLISRALRLLAAEMQGTNGTKTSGNVTIDGGAVIGTWTYTPAAPS